MAIRQSSLVLNIQLEIFIKGYGNVTPKTIDGKLMCIVFMIISIPIFAILVIGFKISTKPTENNESSLLKINQISDNVELHLEKLVACLKSYNLRIFSKLNSYCKCPLTWFIRLVKNFKTFQNF